MKTELSQIECNGCTKCCINDLVPLYPDEHDKYESVVTQSHAFKARGFNYALKWGPNGSCVYLRDHGCSIHDDLPKSCKQYDCRLRAYSVAQMSDQSIDARLNIPQMRAALLEGCTRMAEDAPEDYVDMNRLTKKLGLE